MRTAILSVPAGAHFFANESQPQFCLDIREREAFLQTPPKAKERNAADVRRNDETSTRARQKSRCHHGSGRIPEAALTPALCRLPPVEDHARVLPPLPHPSRASRSRSTAATTLCCYVHGSTRRYRCREVPKLLMTVSPSCSFSGLVKACPTAKATCS
eukprot:scaffold748_cov251-Pinguiococcus_pyrenoidosus.AAC.14